MNAKIFDSILTSSVNYNGESFYMIKPYSIYDFLNQNNLAIEIPSYQRPYSWETKHVRALLEDVENVEKTNSSWFIGPIITAELTPQGNLSQLLDGQQRITTIHIILREAYFYHLNFEDIDFDNLYKAQFEEYKLIQDQLKRCLVTYNYGGKIGSKFSTEKTAKDFFSNYLISITNISNSKDYLKNYNELKDNANLLNKSGSRTAKTILNSINEVSKYFKNLHENSENVGESLLKLNSFISTLLYNIWLIKIPVVKSEYSTKIFESINNRGKGLTLVDKLRFKTLTKFNPDLDTNKILEVNNSWKNIYQLLDKCIDKKDSKAGIIRNEDDFFNVFFNAIDGDDKTKDEDRLAIFEKKYLKSEEKIEQFLSEVTNVLNVLLVIEKPDDNKLLEAFKEEGAFGNKQSRTNEIISKTISLLRLTKNMVLMSSNSRYLIFNMAIRYGKDFKSYFHNYTIGLWHINKLVFYDEILLNEKSNIIRSRYLKLIENDVKYQDFNSIFNQPISAESESLVRPPIYDVCPIDYIINSNSNSAKYSILFTTFLINHKALNWGNPTAYVEAELEHIRPIKWRTYNSEIKCNKEQLLFCFDEIVKEGEFNSVFSEKLFGTLREKFAALSYFNLEQSSAPKESIIEFIGNKVILAKAENKKMQNFNFKEKIEYFKSKTSEKQIIVLPTIGDTQIGISHYENNFFMKEILERSLKFTKNLFEHFEKSLDDVIE